MVSTQEQTAAQAHRRIGVAVEQYVNFRKNGFLVMPQVLAPAEVDELRQHTDDLMAGNLPEQQDLAETDTRCLNGNMNAHRGEMGTIRHLFRPPAHLSPQEKAAMFLRLHMLHRELPLHERYLLHPGVLDVLEVLIGPDVSALQSMLFLKPPGKVGQGWHQDSYYIPVFPDTLCGAWIAIDDCDEYNGAMWFAKGSGAEPIYPPCPNARDGAKRYGFGEGLIKGIPHQMGVSEPDDQNNSLTGVAAKYDQVLCSAKAGDVVFFNGHVLHRSKNNVTTDRFRRAFVGHYSNARSFTQWGADRDTAGGVDPANGGTNGSHILARGDTHLPFAKPRFGTPCAALLTPEERRGEFEHIARTMAEHGDGLMGCGIADPEIDHKH